MTTTQRIAAVQNLRDFRNVEDDRILAYVVRELDCGDVPNLDVVANLSTFEAYDAVAAILSA